MIWFFSSEKTIIFLNAEDRIFLDFQRLIKTAAAGGPCLALLTFQKHP